MNWNKFAYEVHQTALKNGWWDKPRSFDDVICECLVHLGRAYEEYRNGRPNLYYPCNAGGVCEADKTDGKMDCASRVINPDHPEIYCTAKSKMPHGVAVELADCVLRLLDYIGNENVDLTKMNAEGLNCEGVVSFPAFIMGLVTFLTFSRENDKDVRCTYLVAVIYCVFEWARLSNVPMESILREKHEYNKTRPYRPYRHVGKVL